MLTLTGVGDAAAAKKWNRWTTGESGMKELDYQKVARAAIANGWLDEGSAIAAGYSQARAAEAVSVGASQALASSKARLAELKTFSQAKHSLLDSLERFAAVCDQLRYSSPVDAGDAELARLLEEADLLTSKQQATVQELKHKGVFTALPFPRQLIAQLQRLELRFVDTDSRSPTPRPRALSLGRRSGCNTKHAPDVGDLAQDDFMAPAGSNQAFAELAKQSEQLAKLGRQARLKRLVEFERATRACQRASFNEAGATLGSHAKVPSA
ncbi:hypothetical protein ACS5PK_19510 [Roseateles sp. DB2]|uniref:hypothetical protein n=1 Tax=Roseateles sp. DB2 TaxID=3453717 RepID=UPI003EE8F3F1